MKPSRDTGIRLDIEGDMVSIRGPMSVLRSVLPLSLINYIECDGEIETAMCDPVEGSKNVRANVALNRMRRLTEIPEFADWMHQEGFVK